MKPLPVYDPDRLVIFGQADPLVHNNSLTNPQWEYIRDHQQVLVGVAAYGNPRFDLSSGGETRPAQGLFVSGRFFDTLGVSAHLGRTFTTDDDRRGGGPDGPVAVLSYGFWQREFGGRTDAIGKPITLDGHAFTIIGVTARDFRGVQIGRAFDVAAPLGTEPIVRGAESSLDHRSNWWLTVVGRLAPGQTMAQAEAQIAGAPARSFERRRCQRSRGPRFSPTYMAEPLTLMPGSTGISESSRQIFASACMCCSASSRWCWRSPAPTWPICCSRNQWRDGESSRCGCRSARAAASWCGNFWSRA